MSSKYQKPIIDSANDITSHFIVLQYLKKFTGQCSKLQNEYAKDKLNEILSKQINNIQNEIETMKFTRPKVKGLTFDDKIFEEVTSVSSDVLESSGASEVKQQLSRITFASKTTQLIDYISNPAILRKNDFIASALVEKLFILEQDH